MCVLIHLLFIVNVLFRLICVAAYQTGSSGSHCSLTADWSAIKYSIRVVSSSCLILYESYSEGLSRYDSNASIIWLEEEYSCNNRCKHSGRHAKYRTLYVWIICAISSRFVKSYSFDFSLSIFGFRAY